MARRKKDEGGGIPEWMCTFGDMMSLLLCFFIMLFALSIITPVRYQALVDTLQQDFKGYAGSSKVKARSNKTTTTVAESAAKDRRLSTLAGGQPTPGPQGESTEVHTIQLNGTTVRGGVIRFELGSDGLTPQAQWDLRAIFPVLQGATQKIRIRGYVTADEGGGTYQQASDLAFSRAFDVADYLVSLGLRYDFFEIDFVPGTLPERNVLPAGTPPELAGASVEIQLLNQTLRQFAE